MFVMFSASAASTAQDFSIPLSWSVFTGAAEKAGSSQLILVKTASEKATKAKVFLLSRENGKWGMSQKPMSASVGRNGIAEPQAKREGDGKTPAGIFPIGLVFGYEASCPTRMPYIQVTEEDIWVDDPEAPDYNRLTRIGQTNAKSFEHMKRKDDLYKLGLVVEYNTEPVVAGLGSAIFIHYWGKAFNTTSGCLGLPMNHLKRIIRFLEPDKSPVIIFTREALKS